MGHPGSWWRLPAPAWRPLLSQPVALSGGTDGASGVTDATLMGQDVVPRKGMYVLRNSNGCDASRCAT
jgi:hypothetical protein